MKKMSLGLILLIFACQSSDKINWTVDSIIVAMNEQNSERLQFLKMNEDEFDEFVEQVIEEDDSQPNGLLEGMVYEALLTGGFDSYSYNFDATFSRVWRSLERHFDNGFRIPAQATFELQVNEDTPWEMMLNIPIDFGEYSWFQIKLINLGNGYYMDTPIFGLSREKVVL